MQNKNIYFRFIPFGLFIALCGFLFRGLFLDPHHLPSVKINQSLPIFNLPALMPGEKPFKSSSLVGHIRLLNIWGSWCASCSQEQVFLLQLAHDGVIINGINEKDDQKEAIYFLNTWGNPYQSIGMDQDGKVAIDLGVYGAPETFLIDKSGVIRYRHTGILNKKVWDENFLPIIKTLEATS